jgi:hypothetical protein
MTVRDSFNIQLRPQRTWTWPREGSTIFWNVSPLAYVMMNTIAQAVYNAADSMSIAIVEVYGEECLGPRSLLIIALILSRRPAMETVIRMFKLTDTDQYAVPILMVTGSQNPCDGTVMKQSKVIDKPVRED